MAKPDAKPRTLFRHPDALAPNILLAGYCLTAIIVAILLMQASGVLLSMLSALLLAHCFIVCAYFVHDCLHGSIFRQTYLHEYVAQPLLWFLGASYAPYDELKKKHLKHHSSRCDVLSTDYVSLLNQHPRIRKVVCWGQFLHLPSIDLILHGWQILRPFIQPKFHKYRQHVAIVLVSRLAFYVVLICISTELFINYVLALTLCYAMLAFMDAYQHRYEVVLHDEPNKIKAQYDRHYEEAHTYSNLISQRWPWINLLILNFSYHNVHHWKSGEPWYRLPKLHRQRYSSECPQYIGFLQQLRFFHQHRVQRVLKPQTSKLNDYPIGGAGVSFLVGM